MVSLDAKVKGRRKVFSADLIVLAAGGLGTPVILERWGIPREEQFFGTLNAGHPGGMLPLTAAERDTLHNPKLPENLYVADATLLPESMGNPPILTIMALSMKIARILKRAAE